MFSDSHAHIFFTAEKFGMNPKEILDELKADNFQFIMDIGTKAGDLAIRKQIIKEAEQKIPDFIHFAAGLWPHKEAIENPTEVLNLLEDDLKSIFAETPKYAALGECGLDRFWNGENAVTKDNGGCSDTKAEEALFEAQLILAKKYNLAVIVHSREAFSSTLKCIDRIGWHKGVIHCFSYGQKEAAAFLERGWYISFSGNITFPKKAADIEKIAALVRSIPPEKLLLETDSPYMTPAPHRGKPNKPVYIKHTYKKVSDYTGLPCNELCSLVCSNCKTLFAV